MAAKKNVYRYNIYMMKSNISTFDDAIDQQKSFERHDVVAEYVSDGLIIKEKPGESYPPKWKKKLDQIAVNQIGPAYNNSASAVLWVKKGGRVFALPYGHGRKFIREEAVERRFGLKVALNAVDPRELKSVDAKAIDTLAATKHVETSQTTEIHSFGMDLQKDIMRAVAGTPRNEKFARRLVGKDSISIVCWKDIDEIEPLLGELKEAYESDSYKQNFAFVDNIAPVQDPERKKHLNSKLLQKLEAKDTESISLSFPEYIPWEYLDGIRYKGESSSTRHEDLDIDEALEALFDYQQKKGGGPLKIEDIQKYHQVYLYSPGGTRPSRNFSLYRCLNFEIEESGKVAVLASGEWYEADQKFVENLNNSIDSVDATCSITLPDSTLKEKENNYNKRVCELYPDKTINLDTKNVRPYPGETPIEVCDILTISQEFVHVKRKTRSATLSHLFSQGTVSAQNFVQSDHFRGEISKKLPSTFFDIPKKYRPDTTQYRVVYVIVDRRQGKPSNILPLFSKQTLEMARRNLEAMGYRVSLKLVKAA